MDESVTVKIEKGFEVYARFSLDSSLIFLSQNPFKRCFHIVNKIQNIIFIKDKFLMKTIKNIFGSWLLLIILSFSFSIFGQKDFPTIKPGKVYKQSGVTLNSPNQTDWQIVKSDKSETVFVKTNADKKFNAFVKTMPVEIYENVQDLFKDLEKLKQTQLNMANRDSLHFNNTDFKETPCLQYDGIFNHDAAYKYFNFNGYLCRHPTAKNVLIQIEFSKYSNLRGYSESEIKLSKNFFEKIVFSKVLK